MQPKRLNSFQIQRSKLDSDDVLYSAQRCYDLSHSSLISKTIKLSIKNFLLIPLNMAIFAIVLILMSFSLNKYFTTNLLISFMQSLLFCSGVLVVSVSLKCYFGWKEFIRNILQSSDISFKYANQVYSKENNGYFIATSPSSPDNLVIATAAILIDEDKNVYREIMPRLSENEALLTRVGVLPSFHGKGAGRAVVQACIDFAAKKNVKQIKLVTSSSQIAAISLYESLGFRIAQIQEFLPVFRFRKIIMELKL